MLATWSHNWTQAVPVLWPHSASLVIAARFVSVTNRTKLATNMKIALKAHTVTTPKTGLCSRFASPTERTNKSVMKTINAQSLTTAGTTQSQTEERMSKSAWKCTRPKLEPSSAGVVTRSWTTTLRMASIAWVGWPFKSPTKKLSALRLTGSCSMDSKPMSHMIALRQTQTKSVRLNLKLGAAPKKAVWTFSVGAHWTHLARTRDSAKVSSALTSMPRR